MNVFVYMYYSVEKKWKGCHSIIPIPLLYHHHIKNIFVFLHIPNNSKLALLWIKSFDIIQYWPKTAEKSIILRGDQYLQRPLELFSLSLFIFIFQSTWGIKMSSDTAYYIKTYMTESPAMEEL